MQEESAELMEMLQSVQLTRNDEQRETAIPGIPKRTQQTNTAIHKPPNVATNQQ